VGQAKEVSHEKGVERERRTHEDTTEEKVSHERGVERAWVGCRKTGKSPSVSPEWVLKVTQGHGEEGPGSMPFPMKRVLKAASTTNPVP
jgi:hypothetical protein